MATYRRIPLTKMSMTTLQSKLSDAKKKIQELKNELVSETKFEAEKLKVDKANMQIEKLNKELNFQRDRREVSTGLMGTIFGMKDMPESAINRIAVLRNEISIIENSISSTLVKNQTYIKSRIADTEEWLDKIISRIATIEK